MVAQILEGKSVIITGIGPGFGRVLGEEAAKMGARVALVSRSSDVMTEVAQSITRSGGKAITVKADITSQADCERVATETLAAFGRIDGLVNSAYRPGDIKPVTELDLDELRAAMDVTVIGTMRMIRAVVPQMQAQGDGAIVNIGSQVARKIVPNQGGYAATKAALSALSRQLAAELGPLGIRVNMPAFGWTISPPARTYLEEQEAKGGPTYKEAVDAIAANIALRRVPEEVECAHAALAFAGDVMRVVTGSTLDVNGGEYMPL
ncbi:SDR family oxidoreductase [Sphingobium sp. WCS2017Hpa-17]|uniref:SDR family oxidoreductase n=1 Tax=Sphingobium sp. WCS2017Hpa-17 TaxID=3073638 RepID=UPI0028893B73|nr:SDR family oxidoreductase [Sphingobium sp. WCS2017Hpa-17]